MSVWTQQARLEHANRTIVTVRTDSGSFSFLPADLETGPILAPEYGFFVRLLQRCEATATAVRQVSAPSNLLSEKVDAVAGSPSVRGWGSNDTPWFGGNATRKPVTVSTFTLPPRSVAMHPGSARAVAAGWRSPIQGRISISAKLAGADTKGGNGIQWWIAVPGSSGDTNSFWLFE